MTARSTPRSSAPTSMCSGSGGVSCHSPDSIFAFLRWASNPYGTAYSQIDILRAVAPGEGYVTPPHVHPGGDSLLHISGWPRVEKVLQAIEVVESRGIDPADAAPDYGGMFTTARPPVIGRNLTTDTTSRLAAAQAGDAMTGRLIVLGTVAMAVAAIGTTMELE
jgi:hypothetical protein